MVNAVTKLFGSLQNATLILFKRKFLPMLLTDPVAILLRYYSVYNWEHFHWRGEI